VSAELSGSGRDDPRWTTLSGTELVALTVLVKTRLRRMQYRRGLLDGFLAKTGLDLNTLHL